MTEQPTRTAPTTPTTPPNDVTTPWAALTAADAVIVAEVLEHRATQLHTETTAAAVALADPRRAVGDPRGRSVRLVQDLAHAARLTELAAQLRGQDGARGAGAA